MRFNIARYTVIIEAMLRYHEVIASYENPFVEDELTREQNDLLQQAKDSLNEVYVMYKEFINSPTNRKYSSTCLECSSKGCHKCYYSGRWFHRSIMKGIS